MRKRKKDRKPKPDLISRYPSHLRGFATNKYGGSQLQREEGFRGNTYGPAGPVRILTKEEKAKIEKEMRERGDLK